MTMEHRPKRLATHSRNLEKDSGEMRGGTKEVSEQPEGSTGILMCPVRRPVDLEMQVLKGVCTARYYTVHDEDA